jgi:hypothetical protein
MSFYIQASNPTFLSPIESYDDSLKEVIEAIFPYEAEYAFIVWNGFPISLRYKYDIGMIINDILSIINLLLLSEDQGFQIKLDCFTFSALWNLRWTDDSLSISSEWFRTSGKYEDWLNKYNQLHIKKSTFIAEWKILLQIVIKAIEQSNLKVDQKSLRNLYKTEAAITSFGIKYQDFPLNISPESSRLIKAK